MSWPITDAREMKQVLEREGAPMVLIAFEFSAALRDACCRHGNLAISADWRACERGGPHFRGDVREIVAARHWRAIYFVGPSCFQQMRHDQYLEAKIADHRAFWAVAMVLWCVCCTTAAMWLIEQPDTIAFDFIQLEDTPGIEVLHMRTSEYGDLPDKYMRLTSRNMTFERPKLPARKDAGGQPRSQYQYANAEDRDRQRSSWASFNNLSDALAKAERRGAEALPPLNYSTEVKKLIARWREAGYEPPIDANNPDAQPSGQLDRRYLLERGAGRAPQANPARKAWPGNLRVSEDADRRLQRLVRGRHEAGRRLTADEQAAWERQRVKEERQEDEEERGSSPPRAEAR